MLVEASFELRGMVAWSVSLELLGESAIETHGAHLQTNHICHGMNWPIKKGDL